jgi:hypothetical protein
MSPHDKCRGCGAPIIWIRTRDGKHMPCNPEVVEIDPAGAKTMCIVTNDGGVEWGSPVTPDSLFGDMGQVVRGRASHFATCPEAKQFRRR